MSKNILIVDDEEDIRTVIADILEDEGYSCSKVSNCEDAIEMLKNVPIDMLILDIWLMGSKMDGLALLDYVKENYPVIPVVMISGHGNIETAVSAIKKGAYDYIEKPFKSDRLLFIASRALENANLKKENISLKDKAGICDDIIGSSPIIQSIKQTVGKVAQTNSRVLICGPHGSGKEVIARYLHKKSAQSKNKFMVINCTSIHPDRMEEELFGSEHGDNIKQGMFELADKGTLMLDEVGDMSLDTQGKVLRILQEQTYTRLGGSVEISADVRIIATSSRNLIELIRKGEFREDLYYRLNVVPIKVPALKDRREDIPLLAEYFMQKAAVSLSKKPKNLTIETIDVLQAFDWPGNARQLRNLIEWLLIVASDNDDTISYKMLPSEISGISAQLSDFSDNANIFSLPLREARELFEKEYFKARLAHNSNNVSETARQVGMERSALHRKLKTLGIV